MVERIRAMAQSGTMRRFGATLRHQRSGFPANVMVAWNVAEDQVLAAGKVLSSFRQVSHCYWRERCGDFPYNVYTMVHGQSQEECREVVDQMSQKAGQKDFTLLFSKKRSSKKHPCVTLSPKIMQNEKRYRQCQAAAPGLNAWRDVCKRI